MFTNLDFLKVGNKFPAINETFEARQNNFINGRLLYDGNLEQVFSEVWHKIKTRFDKDHTPEQVLLKLNLFRPLTDMFKLLAFQNEPEILIGEGKSEKQIDDVSDITSDDVIEKLKGAFIGTHAQGAAVFKIYDKGNNDFDIALINPENWIPVYEENDLNTIKCHVVAKIQKINNNASGFFGKNEKKYVYFEIHYIGYYDTLVVELDSDDTISKVLKNETGIKTGLNDFAIVPVDFGKPSWKSYANSAYNDLIPIVEEIIVRYSNHI